MASDVIKRITAWGLKKAVEKLYASASLSSSIPKSNAKKKPGVFFSKHEN